MASEPSPRLVLEQGCLSCFVFLSCPFFSAGDQGMGKGCGGLYRPSVATQLTQVFLMRRPFDAAASFSRCLVLLYGWLFCESFLCTAGPDGEVNPSPNQTQAPLIKCKTVFVCQTNGTF